MMPGIRLGEKGREEGGLRWTSFSFFFGKKKENDAKEATHRGGVRVSVLLDKASAGVSHVARIVLDGKDAGVALLRNKALVVGKVLGKLLNCGVAQGKGCGYVVSAEKRKALRERETLRT